jgi:hypothetical protein
VVAEVNRLLAIARDAQRPPGAVAGEHRRLAAPGERAEELLGPEVLVNVNRSRHRQPVQPFHPIGRTILAARARVKRFTEAVH